jgi:hypothetical protein
VKPGGIENKPKIIKIIKIFVENTEELLSSNLRSFPHDLKIMSVAFSVCSKFVFLTAMRHLLAQN